MAIFNFFSHLIASNLLLSAGSVFLIIFAIFIDYYTSKHNKKRRKATKVLNQIHLNDYSGDYIIGILRQVDPYVFEEIILICFKNAGYKIKRNKRYSWDGGIDGVVFDKHTKNKWVIQAKRYSNTINPQHVKKFAKDISRHKAEGGYFVHTGRTGAASYESLQNNIKLISGQTLIDLILVKNK